MAEPLVMLPGFMCDARLFGPQIAALGAERAVHVAPLLGESIDTMAGEVLAHAPQSFALLGHSLGGVVAMELLRRAPDRITRICLMDTNAQADTPQSSAAREPRIVGVKAGRFEEVMREEMRIDYLAGGADRVEVQAQFLDMARGLGPDTYIRQARAMQRRPDMQAVLRRARQPALILCGTDDSLTPVRRHEFIATLMHSARLAVIPGAGHLPTLEAPFEVNQALREWLGGPLLLR